jgi:glycosyltransferase involved in cell wall biosynthesis
MDEGRFTVALVAREVWPFVAGGGIGRTVRATANLLAPLADVTILTREEFREEYESMRAADDPRLPDDRVRFDFVRDPTGFELGPFWSFHHAWSARVYERLCALYPAGGPDLVEFGDYLGEGFVTIQARRSGRPSMSRACVAVRLHGTAEMMAALNGESEPDLERRGVYTLERNCLRFADVLLSPGGSVLEDFQRFYGEIAPGVVVPQAFERVDADAETDTTSSGRAEPLRFVFVGRLQRVKGVDSLVRAAVALPEGELTLTLVGGDTDTAPGGGSMRRHLEEIAAGDDRIRFTGRVPHEEVLQLMRAGDVVVIPSLWESWSNVAREALLSNRPVLATPVGGVHLAVVPGRSGWVSRDTSDEAVREAIEQLLANRSEVRELIASGAPRSVLDEMLEQQATIDAYAELAKAGSQAPPGPESHRVSAVIVRSRGDGPLSVTLDSLARQTEQVLETIAAIDGVERMPLPGEVEQLDRLIALESGIGRAAAREAAVQEARGDLVLLIDSGMVLDPRFVEEALRALATTPTASYATAWGTGIDARAVPIGNFGNLVPEFESAATCSLFRRETLDVGFPQGSDGCSERALYARLAEAGRFGVVVPETLVDRVPFSRPCADALLKAAG